jgi:predicted Fe-Mo cluster-binding NifX family protein
MKIAIPARDQHLESHFGHCAYFAIFRIEDGAVVARERVEAESNGCRSSMASTLAGLGVDVMLADAMGPGAHASLARNGIEVIRGCTGTLEDVVTAFLAGRLVDSPAAEGCGCGGHGAEKAHAGHGHCGCHSH